MYSVGLTMLACVFGRAQNFSQLVMQIYMTTSQQFTQRPRILFAPAPRAYSRSTLLADSILGLLGPHGPHVSSHLPAAFQNSGAGELMHHSAQNVNVSRPAQYARNSRTH